MGGPCGKGALSPGEAVTHRQLTVAMSNFHQQQDISLLVDNCNVINELLFF